jgi:peroxiredoxin
LRQDYQQFVDRDAEVVAVDPGGREELRKYWEREAIPFVGLADPDHAVARLYDQRVSLLRFGRMPALIVVDRSGDIRYRHYAGSMSDIPSNADVLAALDQIRKGVSG